MTLTDYRQCRWFLEGKKAAEEDRADPQVLPGVTTACPYLGGTPKYYLWHAGYSS